MLPIGTGGAIAENKCLNEKREFQWKEKQKKEEEKKHTNPDTDTGIRLTV